MASIDIQVDYYLDEASDRALLAEVKRRVARGEVKGSEVSDIGKDAEPWCRHGLAADIRLAFYRRDANRLEALLAILERVEVRHA